MSLSESSIHLSVVIPAYNEERNIRESLRRVESFMALQRYDWECIVSSDGSKDRTVEWASDFVKTRPSGRFKLLSTERNEGKGFTVRRGILASQGKFILVTDADLSAPIKEVDKLIGTLEGGYDIAIGSRAVREKGADVQQSLKRRLAGRVFNFFVQTIVLKGFLDTQCGFKCFKKEVAHNLFGIQKLNGFSFDVEILYLAKKYGFKVKEVAVMWRQAPGTQVRLVRDSFAMIKDLLKIRKLHSGDPATHA